jgi:hypothetical protein
VNFYETITAAINDVTTNGFDSQKRIDDWVARIKKAAEASLIPRSQMDAHLREALKTIYSRMVTRGGIFRYHPGVERYTIEKLKPSMKRELDRKIAASADLIKLNREETIAKTLRRFQGWATSVPAGGSENVERRDTKASVGKALKSLPFEERRVLIDQGHKLISSINQVVAEGSNAIAAIWHSNWRQMNYDYRKDHKERDGKVYLIKDTWATQRGLVKPGDAGWWDGITKPAEEVFCRCYAEYIYSIRKLPPDMLTQKGKGELERAQARVKGMAA